MLDSHLYIIIFLIIILSVKSENPNMSNSLVSSPESAEEHSQTMSEGVSLRGGIIPQQEEPGEQLGVYQPPVIHEFSDTLRCYTLKYLVV